MNATPNAEAVQAADEVLKPTEIAEELKVSADIVCQWIKAGELTATLVSVDRRARSRSSVSDGRTSNGSSRTERPGRRRTGGGHEEARPGRRLSEPRSRGGSRRSDS